MKTKKIAEVFLAAFAAIISTCSYAQTYVVMAKSASNYKWGYINLTGEFIIPPQFSKCDPFSKEGLALVKNPANKEFYYLNLKGSFIKPQVDNFTFVKGFEDGMAAIKPVDSWGFLDAKGNLVIDAKYDGISYFSDGFTVAQSGERFFVLNKQGVERPVEIPGLAGVRAFSDGLAPYHTTFKVFGFIDTEGKIAIPARYISVGYFTNGLAWAKADDGLVGYIDKSGQWIIQPQFDIARDFYSADAPARVMKNGKWGYVYRTGEMMYVNDAEVWGDFHEGLCLGKKKGKYGFYNATGEWVIEPKFDGVRDFKNGYVAAEKDNKWGIIDKTGNWVVSPVFESIKDVELVE